MSMIRLLVMLRLLAMWAALYIFICLAVATAIYCLKSYGLYAMAKNRGTQNPWMAWIPLLDIYLVGAMVDEMTFNGQTIKNLALLNISVPVASIALYSIPVRFTNVYAALSWLLAYAIMILTRYKLFRQYRSDTGVCVLFTLFSFIGFFALRNDKSLTEK